MSFEAALDEHFPGTLPQADYIDRSHRALEKHGFREDNSIACVGVCRDEICRPLVLGVWNTWGEAFNFSSLAGMLNLGRTGFGAAHAHAPLVEGRERYVYVQMPHIGIGPGGEIGQCQRIGQPGTSVACGALAAFRSELETGSVDATLDPDDLEQSLLKQRLIKRLPWGSKPDLVTVTKLAGEIILADLEHMIELTVDRDKADYAVLTGVQIHGPDNAPFVWPGKSYAVVGAERFSLRL